MQHPEEGTIHSWLDGQLPIIEAADIEAHVAACPTCGAVVAEARGFIAASSRILTALDDAPRGVIPAAAPRSGNRRAMLRAAAAVFVVAAGSFAVLNRTGTDVSQFETTASKQSTPAVANESAKPGSGGSAALDAATAATPVAPPAPEATAANRLGGQGVTRSRVPASGRTTNIGTGRTPATATAGRERSTAVETEAASQKSTQLQDLAVPPQAAASRAAENALSAPTATAFSDVAVESPAPRLVRSDSASGTRRTVFDVGAGQTVVLTESPAETMQLSQVVTTGVATREPTAQSAPRLRGARAGAARQAPAEGVATGAAPAPPSPTAVMAVNTISWVDPSARKRLTLSGPFSVEELRVIRARLDALKAQEQKKTP